MNFVLNVKQSASDIYNGFISFNKTQNTFKHDTEWIKSKIVLVSTFQDKYFELYTMYKQYSSTPSRYHVSGTMKMLNFSL